MQRIRGTGPITVGAILVVLSLLYVVLVPECAALFGCPIRLPGLFYGFDGATAGFVLLLVGIMFLAMGGLLRAYARRPSRIV